MPRPRPQLALLLLLAAAALQAAAAARGPSSAGSGGGGGPGSSDLEAAAPGRSGPQRIAGRRSLLAADEEAPLIVLLQVCAKMPGGLLSGDPALSAMQA